MFQLGDYGVVLFDFDGLLVNTEEIHFRAYQQLCANHGVELPWDFAAYCEYAHRSATGLREALQSRFDSFADWSEMYEEKCQIYRRLIEAGQVALMPGVAPLLAHLASTGTPRAVVTHSRAEHIELIRAQHPELQTIPRWITREEYARPKPAPDCYVLAVAELAPRGESVVGFEDTPRGVEALCGTRAQPVIVCAPDYPPLSNLKREGVVHLSSLSQLNLEVEHGKN